MIINKYGITLTRLTIDDIELVRKKRNLKEIRNCMVYKKKINATQQKKWFESIDNINNIYFLIIYKGEKIGIINGKNTDFNTRTSEGGIFIWNKEHLNSIVPSLCAIIMHDYNFFVCDFEKTYIKVLKNNFAAINFNKIIGYEIVDNNPTQTFYTCALSKAKYFEKIKKYRKVLANISKDLEPLSIKNFSFSTTSDKDITRLYGLLPEYLKEKVNSVLKQENRILLSI